MAGKGATGAVHESRRGLAGKVLQMRFVCAVARLSRTALDVAGRSAARSRSRAPHQSDRHCSSAYGWRCLRVVASCPFDLSPQMADRMASQATLANRLRSAAERTDLDQADVADLVGANPRTVARWLALETEPRTDVRRRLLEVLAVLEHLSGMLQPQAAHDWLFSPNPALAHRKPIELLGKAWRGGKQLLAPGSFLPRTLAQPAQACSGSRSTHDCSTARRYT